jgi:hypothetical protein
MSDERSLIYFETDEFKINDYSFWFEINEVHDKLNELFRRDITNQNSDLKLWSNDWETNDSFW